MWICGAFTPCFMVLIKTTFVQKNFDPVKFFSVSLLVKMLQSYLNLEFIFCHPLVVAVVVTFFFIVNNKITFVQVIVSINTIALSFAILVGGTVQCLLLHSHRECFLEFIPMLLVVLADFSSKYIKGVKPILRPSTRQDIVGTLITNQCVSLWSRSLGEPWRLLTTMLLAV
jgi:hypothetical protein